MLTAALITLAALWWAWLTAADRRALDSPAAIARFTALNLPMVAGIAAASAGLHIAYPRRRRSEHDRGGPQGRPLRRGERLPAGQRHPAVHEDDPAGQGRRLVTALAAMGLVFMGAIVEPVYLVPALTAVLVLGLAAEARQTASAHDHTTSHLPSRISGPRLKEQPCPLCWHPRPTTLVTRTDPGCDDAQTDAGVGVAGRWQAP